jgi:hypothetical protein
MKYLVYINGVQHGGEYTPASCVATPPAHCQIEVTGLAAGTTYNTMTVKAKDQAGNISDNAATVVEFTTEPEDTEGPVMDYATFVSSSLTSAIISVSATDNVTDPVTKFMVKIGDSEAVEYTAVSGNITILNLTAGTEYSNITVAGKDDKNNTGAYISVATFSTAAPDLTKPVMVSATLAIAQTATVINVSATDDVTNPVTKFMVSVNGGDESEKTAIGGQITLTLAANTDYSVVIRAKDDSENISDNSATINFTTAAAAAAGNNFCRKEITSSSGTYKIYVTCTSPSTDNYTILIECANDMDYITDGVYIHNLNGADASLKQYSSVSSDKKTITISFSSTTVPGTLYNPIYIMMPGEQTFATGVQNVQPNWGTCPDETAPVMESAEVSGEPETTSAVISVDATDNATPAEDITYLVYDGSTEIEYTATGGLITLSGLSSGTTYNFTIRAKDNAGNISVENKPVTFSTEFILSPLTGNLGEYHTPTDYKIHYTITYLEGNLHYTVTSAVAAELEYMYVLTTAGNSGVITATSPVGIMAGTNVSTWTQEGLQEGDVIGIRFAYFLTGMETDDYTAEETALLSPNIIIYRVGSSGGTVNIEEQKSNNLSVYPNPTRNELKVSSENIITQIAVTSLSGQTLQSVNVNDTETTLNVSSLQQGSYIATIFLSNGERVFRKFIKL